MCRLATPRLEKAGAGAVVIVNISSMSGEYKNQRMASYGSSKAAVEYLTRNIALDLGPENIRANAIAPALHKRTHCRRFPTTLISSTTAPGERLGVSREYPCSIRYYAADEVVIAACMAANCRT
jgi:7-alpha-hydroxysteroid dehydrogenase